MLVGESISYHWCRIATQQTTRSNCWVAVQAANSAGPSSGAGCVEFVPARYGTSGLVGLNGLGADEVDVGAHGGLLGRGERITGVEQVQSALIVPGPQPVGPWV